MFRNEKWAFENSEMKNEFLWKFRDENDILQFFLLRVTI